ncbi:MAG: STAS domain-containing protein [Candidatus Woesearchaeota archaeon]|nr:MAG: STAS domain-containing protein [Candidatus Woesearchaeota archaeon]
MAITSAAGSETIKPDISRGEKGIEVNLDRLRFKLSNVDSGIIRIDCVQMTSSLNEKSLLALRELVRETRKEGKTVHFVNTNPTTKKQLENLGLM